MWQYQVPKIINLQEFRQMRIFFPELKHEKLIPSVGSRQSSGFHWNQAFDLSCTLKQTRTHKHLHMHTHTHIHTHIHTYTRYTHIHIHTHKHNTHTHTQMQTHTHAHVYKRTQSWVPEVFCKSISLSYQNVIKNRNSSSNQEKGTKR